MIIVLGGWMACAAGALAGWACRFLVIEPEHVQALCTALPAPGWCAARQWLLVVTFPPRFGLFAMAMAAVCWVVQRRTATVAAALALFAAGLGLFLYDTGWSAAAAIAALLRWSRIADEGPDPREFTA